MKIVFEKCIKCYQSEGLQTHSKHWMCSTCYKHLSKGQVPPMSHANNLQIFTEEKECKLTQEEKETLSSLSQLEQTLIALNVPFQLIYQTPVSRWKATQGRLTNVPLPIENLNETITSIPRKRNQQSIVTVQLKKQKNEKPAMEEIIDPQKLHKALSIF